MDRQVIDQLDVAMKKHIDTLVEKQEALDEKWESRANELHEESEKREADIDKTIKQLQKLQVDSESMLNRQRDMEQKLDGSLASFGNGSRRFKTPGQEVIESEDFQALVKNPVAGKGINIRVEDLYMDLSPQAVITNPDPPANTQPLVDPSPRQLIAPATRRLTIRNLIPSISANTNVILYTVENVVTDNAGPQTSENTALGESNITFTLNELPVRTIGHFIKMSEQILEDATALQGYIDTRMRFLLAQEEEDQLLLGSGVAPNLTGLGPQATDFDESERGANDTQLDVLRRAIRQVFDSNFASDGIVLNPTDWQNIELLKVNAGTDDRYIIGNPASGTTPMVWGLPVVETNAMSSGDFLVGSFRLAAQIWDRRRPSVQLALYDDTDFQKLMVTLRVTERLCLTVYRPTALVTGDFNYPAGSPL